MVKLMARIKPKVDTYNIQHLISSHHYKIVYNFGVPQRYCIYTTYYSIHYNYSILGCAPLIKT